MGYFTDHKSKLLQRRLSHYLRNYRIQNKIQSKEMAERFNITASKYSILESEKKPHGRFINSIAFIDSMAKLEGISLPDFIKYLEGETIYNDFSDNNKPPELEWEKILISSFMPINMAMKIKFIEICSESLEIGKTKLEILINIFNSLSSLNISELNMISEIIDAIKKRGGSNEKN
jgi:transcriptional regulator with XRE-family HTH domain